MKYKEFLNKNDNYNLVMLPEHAGDDERSGLIEVPDGAEMYAYWPLNRDKSFHLERSFFEDGVWNRSGWSVEEIKAGTSGAEVLWQRYTQPEELPFIDDDFIENNFKDWSVEMQDHEFKFSGIRVEQFTDVKKTLNERQSSYGCFEDVALVTENIIDALKQVNYSKMPKTHKMAMYMIASKMARLVNGDCNHLDSWHDIGGYAKLIENLIKGE